MTYFEKMPGYIWLNGEFVAWENAKTHVMSHGLHYGSGIFEGIRVYSGRLFKLDAHVKRLFESAEMMKFDINFSQIEATEIIESVAKKQITKDGYVRPFAWRGADQMSIGVKNRNAHFAVAAWEIGENFVKKQEERKAGLRLDISRFVNQTIDQAPIHAKASGLYVTNSLSYYEAHEKNFDDSLMLDSRGFIAEATGSNIFFVFGKKLVTPTTKACLKGITRQAILEIADNLGIETEEADLTLADVAKANEVFLTGTAMEVTPVREIKGQKFKIGAVTQKIIEQYVKMTGE